MGFMEAVKSVYSRYVDFQGRSPRSEYWWFTLFFLIIYLVSLAITSVVPIFGIVILIFYLGSLLPMLAVSIRRLHDLDKSGWFILLSLIPIVNFLLLYWYCLKGTDGDNQFGPDPLGNVADRFN